MSYFDFLDAKAQLGSMGGFEPTFIPDFLFDFQQSLVDWSIRKGRAAIFADCGLGKTPMFLVWAENVVRHTNKPVLVLTPLAVSFQTITEAQKFDIEAHRSMDGQLRPGIIVTPFMGVGSEVYVPVRMGRRGIGFELKPSYFKQAVKNMAAVDKEEPAPEASMFEAAE